MRIHRWRERLGGTFRPRDADVRGDEIPAIGRIYIELRLGFYLCCRNLFLEPSRRS